MADSSKKPMSSRVNVIEESDVRNDTVDTGTRQVFNKFLFGVSLFLVFAAARKVKNIFDYNTYQIKHRKQFICKLNSVLHFII